LSASVSASSVGVAVAVLVGVWVSVSVGEGGAELGSSVGVLGCEGEAVGVPVLCCVGVCCGDGCTFVPSFLTRGGAGDPPAGFGEGDGVGVTTTLTVTVGEGLAGAGPRPRGANSQAAPATIPTPAAAVSARATVRGRNPKTRVNGGTVISAGGLPGGRTSMRRIAQSADAALPGPRLRP
jgi:hypothetical protein